MFIECEHNEYIFPTQLIIRLISANGVNLISRVNPYDHTISPYDIIGYVLDYKVEDDKLLLEVPVLMIPSTVGIKLKPYIIGFTWPPILSLYLICFYT